ncbi:2,4-dienoyl-CoA reductase [Lentinula aff. detonsa]|nr:2,4-dienoyl-CoA reductase [Lentinula aff. detonsa]
MSPPAYVAPIRDSTSSFKSNIFEGKVLFCTGGASGICRGMTEAVMRHGANAVIIGRRLDRLEQTSKELSAATGRSCISAQADVRQPKSLKEAAQKAIDVFGRIDFVICGAAGNFMAPISGLSENAFKTVIEIDTLGTYNTIKATIPHVRATKGAYISVSATLHYNATPYQVHVSAAKAAEGPHGVRSNVIAPGFIAGTEGFDRLANKNDQSNGFSAPLGRFGDVKDVANAAVFLFSDAASYVTGQVIPVDGGAEHLRTTFFPYPQSVLDPTTMQKLMKGKL